MSGKKHKENTQPRSSIPTPRKGRLSDVKLPRRWLGPVIAIVLGVSTLIGGAVASYQMFPRIGISVSEPLDPADPFTSTFHVSNDGYLSIASVSYWIYVNEIRQNPEGGSDEHRYVQPPDWNSPALGPNEGFDLYAGKILSAAQEGGVHAQDTADITVIVSYRPFGLYESQKMARFVTQLGPDNHLHWMKRPPELLPKPGK